MLNCWPAGSFIVSWVSVQPSSIRHRLYAVMFKQNPSPQNIFSVAQVFYTQLEICCCHTRIRSPLITASSYWFAVGYCAMCWELTCSKYSNDWLLLCTRDFMGSINHRRVCWSGDRPFYCEKHWHSARSTWRHVLQYWYLNAGFDCVFNMTK